MAGVDLKQVEQNWFTDQPPAAPVVNAPIPNQNVDLKDVESSWFNEPSGINTVKTVPITQQQEKPILQRMQERLLGTGGEQRYQTFPERLVRSLAPGIAQGLTAPGEALKSTEPITTGEMVEPAANLASIIGTGAIPSVYGTKALIDPATASLANLARETYGIPIRGGQISESQRMRTLDAVLRQQPLSGMERNIAEQTTAFNRSLAKTIGEDAEKITPDVMATARDRLGQNYEDIAAQTTLKLDKPLNEHLGKITDAIKFLQPGEKSAINQHISHIIDVAQAGNGEITGQTYQDMIRRGSPLDLATRDPNSNIRHYAGEIKQGLIDSLDRYAPEDMKALLKKTNSQYRAMKTIEPLVAKSPTGDISPALLMSRVNQQYKDTAYGGGGALSDLAKIGQRFLKEFPSSRTAERMNIQNFLKMGGAGAAAELGAYMYDPGLAMKMLAVGGTLGAGKLATNKALGSILRSDWYANRLINSALPQGTGTPNMLQKLTAGNYPYIPPSIPQLALPFVNQSAP